MLLDVSKYQCINTQSTIASSVGPGKALYFFVLVRGPKVSYKVSNNDKTLYLGDSSVSAAEIFNLADEGK